MSYEKFYPNGWQSGESGGTPITPEALDHMDKGIMNALPKDGTEPMEANLPMGGFKVTGLGTPAAEGDAVPLGYANQNFAPAGYGLGGSARWIPDTDTLKGCNANGWYYWSSANTDVDKPFDAGSMLVIRRSTSYWTQIAIHDATNYPSIKIRKVVDGIANPWDWLNPPMVPGVEYRTTERFDGKVVYTQLINCGTATHGASINIPGVTRCVRYIGYIGYANTAVPHFPLPLWSGDAVGGGYHAEVTSDFKIVGKFIIKTDSFADGFGSGSYTWFVQARYTKD